MSIAVMFERFDFDICFFVCVCRKDPNAEHVEVSDWNKYAEEEYDILVADEGNADLEDGWVTTFYFVVEDEGLSPLGFSNKQSCSLKKKDPASITDLPLAL